MKRKLVAGDSLRVLHVVYSFGIGGSESVAGNLALCLGTRGHMNMVVALEHDGPLSAELEKHGVVTKVVDRAKTSMLRAMIDIAKVCREYRPDIIHTHHMYILFHTVLGAMLTKTPIIHTEHDYWSLDTRNGRLFMPWLSRCCAKITAVNADITQFLEKNFSIRQSFLETVENGIDFRKFQGTTNLKRCDFGLSETDLVGIIAARLESVKNHSMLIRSWKRVVELVPMAKLLIIGTGSLNEALLEEVESFGLNEHIFFIGARRNVNEILPLADVALLSSRDEGLPLFLLEAMATGLPVVATSVGGIPSLISDGVNGRLVANDDAQSFSKAVCDLFNNEQTRFSIGKNAKDSVIKRYDLQTVVDKYLEMYYKIIS